jgi:hypothetical protein
MHRIWLSKGYFVVVGVKRLLLVLSRFFALSS